MHSFLILGLLIKRYFKNQAKIYSNCQRASQKLDIVNATKRKNQQLSSPSAASILGHEPVEQIIQYTPINHLLTFMKHSISTVSGKVDLKFIYLGDYGVGKSSIIEQYINHKFDDNYNPTVGVDFLGKSIPYKSINYRLQLWDSGGQERFRSLISSYLKDANCAIIIYDVVRKSTLNDIDFWIQMFKGSKREDSFIVLVGNKIDLKNRQVKEEEGRKKAQSLGALYFQLSAKTGKNVDQMFNAVIQKIYLLTHGQNKDSLKSVQNGVLRQQKQDQLSKKLKRTQAKLTKSSRAIKIQSQKQSFSEDITSKLMEFLTENLMECNFEVVKDLASQAGMPPSIGNSINSITQLLEEAQKQSNNYGNDVFFYRGFLRGVVNGETTEASINNRADISLQKREQAILFLQKLKSADQSRMSAQSELKIRNKQLQELTKESMIKESAGQEHIQNEKKLQSILQDRERRINDLQSKIQIQNKQLNQKSKLLEEYRKKINQQSELPDLKQRQTERTNEILEKQNG